MKLKKIALLLATTLSATALAACTNTDYKLSFMPYWRTKVDTSEEINESLTYDVTFKGNSATLASMGYELSYGKGSYVTTLTSSAEGYTYTTKLEIPVTYQYGEDKLEETDVVTTEVTFSKTNLLQPISSTKNVKSHSPVNGDVTKLSDCYISFQYQVTTEYIGQTGKSTVLDNTSEEEKEQKSDFSFDDRDYSYVDNETLLLALRAIPTASTTCAVETYNPFSKKIQEIALSFSEKTGKEFSHTVNGQPLTDKSISYRPVTLSLSDKNPGSTQTAWIATGDPLANTHRNVMLYLETPVFYNLGKFEYTLTSAVYN